MVKLRSAGVFRETVVSNKMDQNHRGSGRTHTGGIESTRNLFGRKRISWRMIRRTRLK